jgi:hypothetical protein
MPRHNVAAFILQGKSDFNALTGFNNEVAAALDAMRIEPILIDFVNWEKTRHFIDQALRDYTPQRIIAAFSFSGIGIELGDDSPNGNLWAYIKVPMLSWMLDHPAYILRRHAHPSPAVMPLYTSMDFLGFRRDYIKAPFRTAMCRFGTFGRGQEAQRRTPKKGETPLILFPKSSGNVAVIEERWKKLPVIMPRVIRDAIDHYWDETPRSGNVVASVLAGANAAGLELRSDLPLFSFFIAQVDQYIRYRKGNLLIKELLKLPVHIYGKGFEHVDTAGTKATILPPLDYDALGERIFEALAVVSMNPNIDDDGHDRIYGAFGRGALPVSDINPWWRQNFAPLLPYSYDFRDRPVTAAIEKILADPAAAADLAWETGLLMRTERPFQKFVADAVELALMHRYFTFDFVSPQEIYIRHGA